jgi:hypothetical protein
MGPISDNFPRDYASLHLDQLLLSFISDDLLFGLPKWASALRSLANLKRDVGSVPGMAAVGPSPDPSAEARPQPPSGPALPLASSERTSAGSEELGGSHRPPSSSRVAAAGATGVA